MRSCGGRLGGRSCWLLAVKHNIVHCVWLQSVSEHVESCVATEGRVQYVKISYQRFGILKRQCLPPHKPKRPQMLSALQLCQMYICKHLFCELSVFKKKRKSLTKMHSNHLSAFATQREKMTSHQKRRNLNCFF